MGEGLLRVPGRHKRLVEVHQIAAHCLCGRSGSPRRGIRPARSSDSFTISDPVGRTPAVPRHLFEFDVTARQDLHDHRVEALSGLGLQARPCDIGPVRRQARPDQFALRQNPRADRNPVARKAHRDNPCTPFFVMRADRGRNRIRETGTAPQSPRPPPCGPSSFRIPPASAGPASEPPSRAPRAGRPSCRSAAARNALMPA